VEVFPLYSPLGLPHGAQGGFFWFGVAETYEEKNKRGEVEKFQPAYLKPKEAAAFLSVSVATSTAPWAM
jgi:hypothetical protein